MTNIDKRKLKKYLRKSCVYKNYCAVHGRNKNGFLNRLVRVAQELPYLKDNMRMLASPSGASTVVHLFDTSEMYGNVPESYWLNGVENIIKTAGIPEIDDFMSGLFIYDRKTKQWMNRV